MQIRKWLFLIAFLFVFSFSYGQRQSGDIGIGLQFGEPTGISLQFYKAYGPSLDFLVAWDLDDYFFVNGHALWEKPLGNSGKTNFYYGPGAYIGFREGRGGDRIFNDGNDSVVLGVSGRIGINILIDQFELFAHLTPRLTLIDNTNANMGGGFGGRFFF